jgi:hypothetical protein
LAQVNYPNVLKWPIITYILGSIFLVVAGFVAPGIDSMFPATETDFILDLVFGAWVGSKMVQMGGKYYDGLLGGAAMGVVIGVIEVAFIALASVVAMEGMGDLASGFVFSLLTAVIGALIGAGYASTK